MKTQTIEAVSMYYLDMKEYITFLFSLLNKQGSVGRKPCLFHLLLESDPHGPPRRGLLAFTSGRQDAPHHSARTLRLHVY